MTGKIKVGGVHKNLADVKVKQAGAWKTIAKGWQKNNGVWKVIYEKNNIAALVDGWYDFRQPSNMFQDIAGTSPVTGTGQQIKYVKDLSGNNRHLIANSASAPLSNKVNANPNSYFAIINKSHTYTSGLTTTETAINILPANIGIHPIPQSGSLKLWPTNEGYFRLGVVIIPKPGLTAEQKAQLDSYIASVKTQWGAGTISMGSYFGSETVIPDITAWNMTNCNSLSGIFSGCATFNQNISGWDTQNVTNLDSAFSDCTAFDQPIGVWNTSNVTAMQQAFRNCANFNQPLNSWNTAKVHTMLNMFNGAKKFNQPINLWNVSKVTTMSGMFDGALAFNGNISTWNMANVTDCNCMFQNSKLYNQPMPNWQFTQMSGTAGMTNMFSGASAMTQDLSSWKVTGVPSLPANFVTGSQIAGVTAKHPKWGV